MALHQCFTHYWKNSTTRAAKDKYEHQPLLNLGSGEFEKRGVKVRDLVYPITVVDGQLFLLGRLQVGEILPLAEAKRRLDYDIWDAPFHVIAAEGTATNLTFDRAVPVEITRQLRFLNENGEIEPTFVDNRRLDKQTMRPVRRLTLGSAALLDSLLDTTNAANRPSAESSPTSDSIGLNSAGGAWVQAEVELIVADYFEMLRAELLGHRCNKTEHRRKLSQRLNERSNGSIEFKHQNISAVLVNMGLPYIEGYKPRGNFQALLETVVESYTARHPGFFDQLAEAKLLNPMDVPVLPPGIGGIFVPPPERIIVPDEITKPWMSKRGRKIDFARRDADNRRMAKLGEEFVVQIEKKRLLEAQRDDLAAKVEWVADTCGDGLGYDVLSFNEVNDGEKWVEVKTTGLGKFFPFYVTRNEVRCSEAMPDRFHLYRVFDFSRSAKLYVLPGSLSRVCRLEPVQYRASIGLAPSSSG